MAPRKPTSIQDITPQFRLVGDPGWDTEIRSLFESYGAPLPTPATEQDIRTLQTLASGRLPEDYVEFMGHLGPVDFGYAQLLGPTDICASSTVSFYDRLTDDDKGILEQCLTVCDLGGSGNFLALDLAANRCRYLCHDPMSIPAAFGCFSDFVRWAMVGVYVGHYGWPDDEVAALVDQFQEQITELRI